MFWSTLVVLFPQWPGGITVTVESVIKGSAVSLLWRHNERDGVSNHRSHDCLLNRLFRRRSKRTLKLRVTDLWAGNSPVTGEFPAHRACNAGNVSIWWRHHRWALLVPLLLIWTNCWTNSRFVGGLETQGHSCEVPAMQRYPTAFTGYYSEFILASRRLKWPVTGLFVQQPVQANNKKDIKDPRHWPVDSLHREFPCRDVMMDMMTSSNENNFSVTGPLCGEFTGHRWIPRTPASIATLASALVGIVTIGSRRRANVGIPSPALLRYVGILSERDGWHIVVCRCFVSGHRWLEIKCFSNKCRRSTRLSIHQLQI